MNNSSSTPDSTLGSRLLDSFNISSLESESAGLDPEVAAQLHIAAAQLACNITIIDAESEKGPFCPQVFDGWTCWNRTEAGKVAYASCPWFVPGFDSELKAHKTCLEDGSWFRHPESGQVWSNYTTCVDLDAYTRYRTLVTLNEIGYLVSLTALVTSLAIFCLFRSLQCTRVHIHKHLFVSFIVNNGLWLVWYRFVVNESRPVNELDQTFCAILHLSVQYFLLANYFWMFCEGFYLHTLLVYAFTRAESTLLKCFYVFGWLGPSIPITLYAFFRATDDDTQQKKDCWIHDSDWTYILSFPVCIGLLVSLAFLINILRVLVIKLNANNRRGSSTMVESAISLRKAARATLILIPLLGIHYLITPLRPAPSSPYAIYYDFLVAFSSSLQGLCVSLLFCFCNGEVIAVVKRKLATHGKTMTRSEYSYGRAATCATIVKLSDGGSGDDREDDDGVDLCGLGNGRDKDGIEKEDQV